MQDFRNLKVWQKAHALTLNVYRDTLSFPSDERFGLTCQLRRASASIAANLAEGSARAGNIDFARFVNTAAGSASEVDYHLLLARELEYLSEPRYLALLEQISEIKRMPNSLERTVRGESLMPK